MNNSPTDRRWSIATLAALLTILCFAGTAYARVFIGVGVPIGGPVYYPSYYYPYPAPAYPYPPAPYPLPYPYAQPPAPGPLGYGAPPPPAGPQPQGMEQQSMDTSHCRDYKHSIIIDGEKQDVFGTACKQPDGSWRVVK